MTGGWLHKEEKAGLYITLIVHLLFIIILLIAQIDATRSKETSFVLDFTRQEELEKQQKEAEQLIEQIEKAEQMRAAIQEKINKQLGEAPTVKNITVNKGALKDDRGTDVKELMKEAEKVQNKLKENQKLHSEEEEAVPENKAPEDSGKESTEKAYSGASVLSWQLDGRNAVKLKIPAYKCYGAGTVTVIITVDNAGRVIEATVQDGSIDKCHRNAAVSAAKASRFSAKPDGTGRQIGNIVYEFIAQ